MRNSILTALVVLSLTLSGCAGSNDHGECIGFWDKEDPRMEYRLSKRNVIVGIVFFETIIVPVVVALSYARCPQPKVEVKHE